MILAEISKFLYFILIGGIIGILFDIFRIFRKCFKTSDFITYVHDILFLLISAIILLISIFIINNGEIRAYMFFGIILGIIIYLFTLSKYFILFSTKVILFLKKIIINPIINIFKVLINKIKKLVHNIRKIFNKKISQKLKINIKNSLKNRKSAKNITNFNK